MQSPWLCERTWFWGLPGTEASLAHGKRQAQVSLSQGFGSLKDPSSFNMLGCNEKQWLF